MANKSNQEIANEVFKKNNDLQKVFVCGKFPFATENAANLHKNTSGKKDLKVFPFTRTEGSGNDDTGNTDEKPVKLDRLKLAELQIVAKSKGIRPDENATRADIIKLIEDLDKSQITE